MGLQRGGSSKKKKLDPEGGSTLILKGIKEEQSTLFLTVVCVNVFSYHTDVIFWYFKVSCQSFLLSWQPHSQDPEVRGCWRGTCNYSSFKIPVKQQFCYSSFIRLNSLLAFSLFFSCSAYMSRNCLVCEQAFGPLLAVFFPKQRAGSQASNCLNDPCSLLAPNLTFSDVTTVCSTVSTGLSLILLNLYNVDNVLEPTILSTSSLSESEVEVFFSKWRLFLHAWYDPASNMCLYKCHFPWRLPLKHDSMMYQV